jgi:hypothetical protein
MADEVKILQDTYITENLILKIILLVFRKYDRKLFAKPYGQPYETNVYKRERIMYSLQLSIYMHSYIFNSIIIYVLSQQLQGQLQTQHSLHTSNYIMEQYNI